MLHDIHIYLQVESVACGAAIYIYNIYITYLHHLVYMIYTCTFRWWVWRVELSTRCCCLCLVKCMAAVATRMDRFVCVYKKLYIHFF